MQHRGKRTASSGRLRKTSRKKGIRRPEKKNVSRSKECWQFAQFIICGSIFVLLVACKLLIPSERLTAFQERMSGAIEQNMDVQAVFSAVGRAFKGEKEAAQDVYQAVFHPGDTAVAEPTEVILPEESMTALDMLQTYRKPLEELPAQAEATDSGEQQVSTLAYVLYSDKNLPENVSLEQAILDFAYCVPVSGTISSAFGYREHPTEGEERFHYGIDLAANLGTEVVSFADGNVKAVGESSSYGKYCVIEHDGGYSTLYAHCNRIRTNSGADVKKGEIIAEVGETGMTTGPHLHFELQQNGKYFNPVYYVKNDP